VVKKVICVAVWMSVERGRITTLRGYSECIVPPITSREACPLQCHLDEILHAEDMV